MKKRFAALTAVVLALALALCGCGSFLSDNFDKDTLGDAAEALVAQLTNDDIDAIYASTSDSFKELTTQEDIEGVWLPAHADLGKYVRTNGISLQGDGEDLAIAVIAIKYENDIITVQVAYNVDMEIVALNFK